MPRSAKEKAEIDFFVPETFRICALYHEEAVLWNQGTPEYFKIEKRYDALERMKSKIEEEYSQPLRTAVQLL